MSFRLATYLSEAGPRAGLVVGDRLVDAAQATGVAADASVQGILDAWESALPRLDAAAKAGGQGIALAGATLLSPIPLPGAVYCAGSNYGDHAAEMAPYLAMAGEFRVHYAGFFDPGFGHAAAGGTGSRGVLEVRCHEAPFVLEHGQVVGRLVYERMSERPDTLYGAGISSNYQGQGLKLAKQFRME